MNLKESHKKHIICAILLLIVLYTAAYSVAFAIGPSHMGDDISYAFYGNHVATGTFVQSPGDVLSIRILQIIPIGVFYYLFGAGILTSAAWDMLSFVLSVMLVFLIGREIYDDYVGLLAAFLLSIFPLVAIYAVSMSDNIPMMFFVCLAVFTFLKATKKNSKKWFFAFGAAIVAPVLTTPQGFEIWLILGFFVLVQLARKKLSINRTSLFFVYGFVAAMLVLFLFNYLNTGYPLITFTENLQYYGQTTRPDLIPLPIGAALSFYPGVMFPYDLTGFAYQAIVSQNFDVTTLLNIYQNGGTVSGFFFYALILAALYLVIRKDRNSYFPLVWTAVGILYLELGPQSIGLNPLTYVLSHRLDRYLTLVAPPIAIILSAALITVVRTSRERWRYAKMALASVVVIFLAVTSLQLMIFMHSIAQANQFTQLQAAQYLDKLPNTTKLYSDPSFGDIAVYMDFSNISRFMFGYGGATNCSGIPGGVYVLLPRYVSNPFENCTSKWILALSPRGNFSQLVIDNSQQYMNDLYYVPSNSH